MLKPLKIVNDCEQCPLDPGFQSDPLHPRRNQGRGSVTKTLPQSFGEEWDFKSYSQELHNASKESWSDVTFSSFQSLLSVISMLATHLKVMSFNWIGCPARAKTVEKKAADSKWGQFWKPLEVFHGFPEDFAAAFLNFSALFLRWALSSADRSCDFITWKGLNSNHIGHRAFRSENWRFCDAWFRHTALQWTSESPFNGRKE